jgi:hypothetical protein
MLRGLSVPGLMTGDLLALFPVTWIQDVNSVRYPDKPLWIEHTDGAHFEIVGEVHHGFAKYLQENSEILTPEQWLVR